MADGGRDDRRYLIARSHGIDANPTVRSGTMLLRLYPFSESPQMIRGWRKTRAEQNPPRPSNTLRITPAS